MKENSITFLSPISEPYMPKVIVGELPKFSCPGVSVAIHASLEGLFVTYYLKIYLKCSTFVVGNIFIIVISFQ